MDQELKETMEYIRANEDDEVLVMRLKKAAKGELAASGILKVPTNEDEKELYNLAVDMITSFYYDNRGIVPYSNNLRDSVTNIIIKLSRTAHKKGEL